MLFYIADRLPRFIAGAMDARGNGQYLAETAAQRYGARIAQVMLSESMVSREYAALQGGVRGRHDRIPEDADVLADHRAIVLEQGVAKVAERRTGADGKGRHGDSAMAAALAFFASRADGGQIAYIPARLSGRRERFDGGLDGFDAPPAPDDLAGGRIRGF